MPEEHLVATCNDILPNEMKQLRAGPTDVLLINLAGTLHAVEPLCPHYKQPLADGLICDGKLRCGWHQSVFDVASGHVCEPPALEALKKYPVRLDGKNIYVDIATFRTDRRRFVIIGGGAAGFAAATSLRENGFTGDLTILSADSHAPYDRPNLSKDFLAGNPLDTPLPLRDESFYREQKIDLRLDSTAVSIDRVARTVFLKDGAKVFFDSLLIATGGRPRTVNVPSAHLAGIHTLRTFDDAQRLITATADLKRVTIIGGSFIAMEAAAALQQRGLKVTVVLREQQPLVKKFGEEIGRMIRDIHEAHGVTFHSGQTVQRFEGDSHVRSVVLADGTTIDCDIVLIAVGVDPATDFLRPSLEEFIEDDGGIRTDAHLKVCDEIYVAGDIARFPIQINSLPVRIEHWRFAQQLGRLAALNMLGTEKVFDEVPYFWTYQYDLGLDYIGHADGWEEIIIDGRVDKQDFLACYVQSNRIAAVCCCGRSAQACAVAELMKRDGMPTADTVRGARFDFVAALRDFLH